jgi:hypothetical protein
LRRSFKTRLSQLWFPKEFRLPGPEFGEEQLESLEELIHAMRPIPLARKTGDTDDGR